MPLDINKLTNRYYPAQTNRTLTGQDEFARFTERRFWSMSWSRNAWYNRIRRTFPLWDVFRPWLLEGENFNKAVRFPTLRDVARAMTDEIMKSPPKAELIPVDGENPNRAQALQFKLKSRLEDTYEKIVQEECINDMVEYGEGFRMPAYYDVSFWDEEDKVQRRVMDDIGSERFNPFHVYLDPHGRYIWEPKQKANKRDAILKYQYPHSKFIDLFKEVPGIINLDAVPQVEHKMTGELTTPTTAESEETETTGNRFLVNAYVNYNQEEQFYGIVANGVTILEPRTIPNKHRRIPLVNYKFERRQDEVFYGNSLAELIAPHIYAQDTIFNLELQGVKLDLMPATMVDSDLGYNRKVHKMHPRAVWQMNVPPGRTLQQSVVPFQRQPRDAVGYQNMNNQIESNMTITSGIDRRSLFLSPGELATQTAFKSQTLQKRVNRIVFSNELLAEANLVELMVSDLKQYLPEKIEKQINGQTTKRFRKVRVEGYQVIQNNEGEADFVPQQGAVSTFDLTPQAVDVDVEVRVINMREKAVLQDTKNKRLLEFLPIATNMVGALGQQFPQLAQLVDFVGIIEQTAEGMDLDLSRTIKSPDMADFDQIDREHKAMQLGVQVPVPADETYEKSLEHKKQHEMLRWVFRDGVRTNNETTVWKGMSQLAKDEWVKHYVATLLNIKNKVLSDTQQAEEQLPGMLKQAPEGAIPGATPGPQPGQVAPTGTIPTPARREPERTPEEAATQKTLLRE